MSAQGAFSRKYDIVCLKWMSMDILSDDVIEIQFIYRSLYKRL